jgi:hypothetical protein
MISTIAESDSKTCGSVSCGSISGCFPFFWRTPLALILDATDPIMELPCKENYAEFCHPITTCISVYEEIEQSTKGLENCLFSHIGNQSLSMDVTKMTSFEGDFNGFYIYFGITCHI